MIDFDEATHTYWYKGIEVPSVSRVLKEAGYQGEGMYKPEYAERGTAVHYYTEMIDKGEFNYSMAKPEYLSYVAAYEWFLDEHDFKPEQIEEKYFSHEHLYAGTVDRVGEIDGVPCLLDVKTGFYAKWHHVQLAAYDMLVFPQDEIVRFKYDLYLTSDGMYKLKQSEKAGQEKAFLDALGAYWYKHEMDYKRLRKVI